MGSEMCIRDRYKEAYLSFEGFDGVVFTDGTKIYADVNIDKALEAAVKKIVSHRLFSFENLRLNIWISS